MEKNSPGEKIVSANLDSLSRSEKISLIITATLIGIAFFGLIFGASITEGIGAIGLVDFFLFSIGIISIGWFIYFLFQRKFKWAVIIIFSLIAVIVILYIIPSIMDYMDIVIWENKPPLPPIEEMLQER